MEANDTRLGYYMLENIPGSPFTNPIPIISKEAVTVPVNVIYDLEIQPLQGEASGYWANGVFIGSYN